ncbi:hypothetical protein T265_02433, partial [Opisthorchis viverrini]
GAYRTWTKLIFRPTPLLCIQTSHTPHGESAHTQKGSSGPHGRCQAYETTADPRKFSTTCQPRLLHLTFASLVV